MSVIRHNTIASARMPTNQTEYIAPAAETRWERVADFIDRSAAMLPEPVRKVGFAVAAPAYLGFAGALIGGSLGAAVGALGGPITAIVASANGALMLGGLGLGVGASLGANALR